MPMTKTIALSVIILTFSSAAVHAQGTAASDQALLSYRSAGATEFSATRGEALFKQEVVDAEGNKMACVSCHSTKLNQAGEHYKTHKPIEPMARSANPERYTDIKKIEKWFKRNCKDTWARECTAQEKGDILVYLLAQ